LKSIIWLFGIKFDFGKKFVELLILQS